MYYICQCTPKTSKWMATTRNWHFFSHVWPTTIFRWESRAGCLENDHNDPAALGVHLQRARQYLVSWAKVDMCAKFQQHPMISVGIFLRFVGWDYRQIRSWVVKHVLRTIWQHVSYCSEDFEILFGFSILNSASLCFQGFSAIFFFAWFDTCVFLSISAEDISKDPAY